MWGACSAAPMRPMAISVWASLHAAPASSLGLLPAQGQQQRFSFQVLGGRGIGLGPRVLRSERPRSNTRWRRRSWRMRRPMERARCRGWTAAALLAAAAGSGAAGGVAAPATRPGSRRSRWRRGARRGSRARRRRRPLHWPPAAQRCRSRRSGAAAWWGQCTSWMAPLWRPENGQVASRPSNLASNTLAVPPTATRSAPQAMVCGLAYKVLILQCMHTPAHRQLPCACHAWHVAPC